MPWNTHILKWHRFQWRLKRFPPMKRAMSWTGESFTTGKPIYHQPQRVAPWVLAPTQTTPRPASTVVMDMAEAVLTAVGIETNAGQHGNEIEGLKAGHRRKTDQVIEMTPNTGGTVPLGEGQAVEAQEQTLIPTYPRIGATKEADGEMSARATIEGDIPERMSDGIEGRGVEVGRRFTIGGWTGTCTDGRGVSFDDIPTWPALAMRKTGKHRTSMQIDWHWNRYGDGLQRNTGISA